jgi:RNA polymerase sigma-70 factor (ECF subfamily)
MDDAVRDWELERFRSYLMLLARQGMGELLRAKDSPEDLVQEALAEAHGMRDRFRGTSEGQLAEFLRMILHHTIIDRAKGYKREKRNAALERSLEERFQDSSRRLLDVIPAHGDSPSRAAIRGERAFRLLDALAQLPPAQRDAVAFRHLQGKTLAEIAAAMRRSELSVASLIHRGLTALRASLRELDA